MCEACSTEARAALHHTCRQCGIPLGASRQTSELCGACLTHPPFFDTTIAAAVYAPPFDQLVLGLKFHAQLAHASLFAKLLLQRMDLLAAAKPDVLVPVPLSHKHLSTRGFNQALEIARLLGAHLHAPVLPELAVRALDTLPQASLPYDARQQNIRGAFMPGDVERWSKQLPKDWCNLHIGIVDDVMTTGATLNELARTLKKAGVRRITNLVVARTI